MTSILNNAGAMIALATLAQTNRNLLEAQTQIATGKEVDSAAQDAAIWAVTTVMEADIDGFNAISDSLSLGKATVTVARNAAEKVTDLLREMKEKIVTAQGENVDRAKIQTDIDELKNQIGSIVSAAQFNGLNLINGSKPEGIEVISSLDRSTTGVESASIKVRAQDLSTGSAVAGDGPALAIVAEDSETNAAVTPNNANLQVTWANGTSTTAAQYELYVDGASVGSTVSIAVGSTDEQIAQAVQQYISGTGRTDIKASVIASGVQIESTLKFDTVSVELKELQGPAGTASTGADAATILDPGVSSVQTSSTDSTDSTPATAAFSFEIDAAVAAGDIEVYIDGVQLGTNYNVNSTNATTEAAGLATFINAEIAANTNFAGKITAVNNGASVALINNTGQNFTIEAKVIGGGATNLELKQSNAGAAGFVANGDNVIGAANSDASVSGTLEGKGADIDIGSVNGSGPANAIAEGDTVTVFLREGTDGPVGEFTYVAQKGDDENDIARGLKALIQADPDYDVFVEAYVEENTPNNALLRIDSTGSQDVFVAVEARAGGTAGGGLGKLGTVDVSSAAKATASLDTIEELIQTSIDAAAAFGSSERRLDIQADFVNSLVDSFKTGVGALVDTNMEEASARLQALQVQQQLGTQALSIANASPQSVLALFR